MVTIKKTDYNQVDVIAGGRRIGTVRGELFTPKKKTIMVRTVIDKKTGQEREEKYEHWENEKALDTLLEKAKCIVEWFNIIYNPQQFGSLQELQN